MSDYYEISVYRVSRVRADEPGQRDHTERDEIYSQKVDDVDLAALIRVVNKEPGAEARGER